MIDFTFNLFINFLSNHWSICCLTSKIHIKDLWKYVSHCFPVLKCLEFYRGPNQTDSLSLSSCNQKKAISLTEWHRLFYLIVGDKSINHCSTVNTDSVKVFSYWHSLFNNSTIWITPNFRMQLFFHYKPDVFMYIPEYLIILIPLLSHELVENSQFLSQPSHGPPNSQRKAHHAVWLCHVQFIPTWLPCFKQHISKEMAS